MSTEIKRAISESLKEIRSERGIDVSLMADLLDIPASTFETYLYAQNIPSLDTIIRICNQFHYPVNNVFAPLIGDATEQPIIRRIYSNFGMLPEIKRKQVYQTIEPLVRSMMEDLPDLKSAGFGQRIRILREDCRITLTEAAEAYGIKPDTLKVLESNQRLPSIVTFLRLCKALKVSPEYLLCNYLTYPLSVDKGFYFLKPRELAALAEASSRLCKQV